MIRNFLSRARGRDRLTQLEQPVAINPDISNDIAGETNGNITVATNNAGERSIELPRDVFLSALTHPVETHRITKAMAQEQFGPDVALGKDVRVKYPLDQLLHVPHEAIWANSVAALIHDSIEELIAVSKDLKHEEIFDSHYGPVDPRSFNKVGYMKGTRLRVLRLYEALQKRGMHSGTILEVGCLYGCFAFILQRLGYQVTAIDRYQSYGPGFQPLVELMKTAGVEVISATRENEEQILGTLGEYDCGITMAVVEHIPHTPRVFLEGVRQHIRTGGILAVDTPNLARYWNRVKLQSGESVFMDIKSQYYTDIPFEGHHREYTADELHWIFEQLGCEEIEDEFFDYNLISFDAIDRPHIECLLRIIEDPSHADMLLTTGRVSRPD